MPEWEIFLKCRSNHDRLPFQTLQQFFLPLDKIYTPYSNLWNLLWSGLCLPPTLTSCCFPFSAAQTHPMLHCACHSFSHPPRRFKPYVIQHGPSWNTLPGTFLFLEYTYSMFPPKEFLLEFFYKTQFKGCLLTAAMPAPSPPHRVHPLSPCLTS